MGLDAECELTASGCETKPQTPNWGKHDPPATLEDWRGRRCHSVAGRGRSPARTGVRDEDAARAPWWLGKKKGKRGVVRTIIVAEPNRRGGEEGNRDRGGRGRSQRRRRRTLRVPAPGFACGSAVPLETFARGVATRARSPADGDRW